jgi:hypothetical protein
MKQALTSEQMGLGLMISMLKGEGDVPTMTTALSAHGGITYTDRCQAGGKICHVAQPGESEDVWWIGFDCAHSGDVTPAYDGVLFRFPGDRAVYRTVEYVKREVAKLAEELAVVAQAVN